MSNLKLKSLRLAHQRIYFEDGTLWGVEFLCREERNGGIFGPQFLMRHVNSEEEKLAFDKEVIIQAFDKVERDFSNAQDIFYTINIHPETIGSQNFSSWLINEKKRAKINSNNIVLEITESSNYQDQDLFLFELTELKTAGFKIALDDFGNLYSNYDRYFITKDLIDIIKITHDICTDELILNGFSSTFSEYIKNKALIAECIENEKIANYFKSFGINLHQGYLYHRPQL
ncbi:EAL domain-containing protein [Enterobacter cancerogenus]